MRTAGTARVAIVVAAGLLIAITLTTPRVAHACSASPDYNPAAESDLVVAGYITNLEILNRTGIMTYLHVQMTFEVDQYLFGSGPTSLDVFDGSSATPSHHLIPGPSAFDELDLETLAIDDLEYGGGGGACGALDEDPRGHYWVVGLSRHPDTGQLHMNRIATFAVGSGPADSQVIEGIERVRALLLDAGLTPAPGSTGNAGFASRQDDFSSPIVTVASVLAGALLLAGARILHVQTNPPTS